MLNPIVYIDPETASMEDLEYARKECFAIEYQLNQAILAYINTRSDIVERCSKIHNEIQKRLNQNNQ